jgi:hypothetical protein
VLKSASKSRCLKQDNTGGSVKSPETLSDLFPCPNRVIGRRAAIIGSSHASIFVANRAAALVA